MSTFLTILIVIVAILLILIVVIQNSKGGGLAAGFQSSNQVMGVRKTTDFLEKATWYLAGAVVVLCIVSTIFVNKGGDGKTLNVDQDRLYENTQTGEAVPFEGSSVEGENAPAEGENAVVEE
ncbi:preprotein translocase subunit SecG [Bacteroidales bacterium OttesenSCG-928-I14]|nr:preprotein translocase subunit SecG [Bacteroidales bacterium OttesenSCG-928-I14]